MKKREYKFVFRPTHPRGSFPAGLTGIQLDKLIASNWTRYLADIEGELNALAKDGWRVVNFHTEATHGETIILMEREE
jgi:hypothetical protein